jgi:hypothetical protein
MSETKTKTIVTVRGRGSFVFWAGGRPYILRSDKANVVPDRVWGGVRRRAKVKAALASGRLEELANYELSVEVSPERPPAIVPQTALASPQTAPPPEPTPVEPQDELAALRASEARELVSLEDDQDQLRSWLEAETRVTVTRTIKDRLAELED